MFQSNSGGLFSIAPDETPVIPSVVSISPTSATLSWPPNTSCLQYLVVYSSLSGKEGILVTPNPAADLTDLREETTYVGVVICISATEGYIVDMYTPITFK